MRMRRYLPALCAVAFGWAGAPGMAATVQQTTVPDFATGITTGAAALMGDPVTATTGPQAGGIGIMPPLGASIFSDEFSYTTVQAAQNAGWLFMTPNAEEIAALATAPTEFLFSGDTSTTGGSAPAAGKLRLRVSRPHDLTNTETASTRQPVLAMYSTPVTGDFIAETRVATQYERFPNVTRHQGIFVTHPSGLLNGKAEGVTIDAASTFVAWGPSKNDFLNMLARLYDTGSRVINYQTQSFPGTDYTVRLVKRGNFYFGYIRTGDSGPWVFQSWFSAPNLAATDESPVIVGVFGKSWGSVSATSPQYGDSDFDYFHLNRVGSDLTGTYSNVVDGGAGANWHTLSMVTHSMQGLKYQLRTGNAASGGTLTDGGTFAGPDGTAASYFEDDAAQVIPNGNDKRYLEYKFFLDGGPVNLPAYLDSVTTVFTPPGVRAAYASSKADFGADGGGLSVQPGDGDLSLTRTQIYRDDFATDESAGIGGDGPDGNPGSSSGSSGWIFTSGNGVPAPPLPDVIGGYTMTQRAGYFRMKVGYPHNIQNGSDDQGGMFLRRSLPSGVDDYEIETEVEMDVQQSRQAGLVVWQDPDNFVGITAARRNETTFEVGVLEQSVLNDGALALTTLNYGSNRIQLRVTKVGQIFTFSVRDAASPSPSWRVVGVRNTTGSTAGGFDFFPYEVGLIGKSYGLADRNTADYDFSYFSISSVAPTGSHDIPLALPAGSRADVLRPLGDALTGANARFQIASGGGFVGPDGTSGTFFSPNEPKLPATVTSPATVRVTLDSTTTSGAPYLHALGLQYAAGDTIIARDTNASDFTGAALKDNVDTATTPGVAANGGGLSLGTPVRDDFNYTSHDLTGTPWIWDNPANPLETQQSDYSFTANPGHLRLLLSYREDHGTPSRYHALFARSAPVSGDWQIETLISLPDLKESGRITGLGVWQDNSNNILYGMLNTDQLAQRAYNANAAVNDTTGAGTYPDASYYLMIRKTGQIYTSLVKSTAAGADWVQVARRTFNGITNPRVGLMAKSASPATNVAWPADYDYFTFTPLNADGVIESRVLDLGTGGNAPTLTVQGTGTDVMQFQFRASDTQAGLTSLPYVGPDGTAGSVYAGNYSGALAGLNKRYVQYRLVLPVGTSVNDVALISAAVPGGDALTALRIAGGLQTAASGDIARYDVVAGASAGKIDIADVVKLLRTANGL
jgi:hypothetical protein